MGSPASTVTSKTTSSPPPAAKTTAKSSSESGAAKKSFGTPLNKDGSGEQLRTTASSSTKSGGKTAGPSDPKDVQWAQYSLRGRGDGRDRPGAMVQERQSEQNSTTETDIPAERRAEIESFVDKNHDARESTWLGLSSDGTAGGIVGDALLGKSPLGTMTEAEQGFLADKAAFAWSQTHNLEAVREAGETVAGDTEASRALAGAFAKINADLARTHASGIDTVATREYGETLGAMLDQALKLDPKETLRRFEGVEDDLARTVSRGDRETQTKLLDAVANSEITGETATRFTSSMFFRANEDAVKDAGYRKAMAGALAAVNTSPNAGENKESREAMAARLEGMMATEGGRSLFFKETIRPDLRQWSITKAIDAGWTAGDVAKGWESNVVGFAFARQVNKDYEHLGRDPLALPTGEGKNAALRNFVGLSLRIPADQQPPANETVAAEQARLAQGFNVQYYGPNAQIDAVVRRIEEKSGKVASVSVVPVTVTNAEHGVAVFSVFKFQGADGQTYYTDERGKKVYTGFADWQANNDLPKGRMTYATHMDPSRASSAESSTTTLRTENTPDVVDTTWERVLQIGDGVATAAGIIGGAVVIGGMVVGTGGLGAIPLIAGGAAVGGGVWHGARGAGRLYDDSQHGVNIWDPTNPEVRGNWIDVAAGTLSVGAFSGAVRLARSGQQVSAGAARFVAGMQLGANVVDTVAIADQSVQLAQNWEKMSGMQRTNAILNIAFWGGMMTATTRASGGSLADAYSFAKLKNQLQFGSPYPVAQGADLQPGQMRVVYDQGANGRATNIRIETGGGRPDPVMLDLHSRTARQIEAAGGLQDRLSSFITGDQPPKVGSAAWEARLEIDKIARETRALTTELNSGRLSPDAEAAVRTRLEELGTATKREADRLTLFSEKGRGWVAAPETGAEQAKNLGWEPAPDGYSWVAHEPQPFLRRQDGTGERLRYDPNSRTFIPHDSKTEPQRVGHGQNEAVWKSDDAGNLRYIRANLREFYVGAGRSADELAAQRTVRGRGVEGDHAGHGLGHRFVLNQGLKNLFPQDGNFNVSAYKTLENEWADWISVGGDVRVGITFKGVDGSNSGRPTQVVVRYEVVDPATGRVVHKGSEKFRNQSEQTYDRVDSAEIRAAWEARGTAPEIKPYFTDEARRDLEVLNDD